MKEALIIKKGITTNNIVKNSRILYRYLFFLLFVFTLLKDFKNAFVRDK